MKFTKMSLVAALLIGSSAFAIENTKVSGDAKLYYDTTSSKGLQDYSRGQIALGLGATTDLVSNVSAGFHATVLTTLGLENNLVGGVWAGNISANGNANGNHLQSSNGTGWWIDQAWLAASYGKTTAKVGRMEIDTPLAFTEKWNIAENTFEAFVVINQDIPDTTLVGAYVGGSNGANGQTVQNAQNGTTPFSGYTTYNDGAEAAGAALGTNALDAVGGAGAYAVGIVNNSVKPLTVQAWYYNVLQVADAYWLQADVNVNGILAGAQYADMTLKNNVTSLVAGTNVNVKAVVDGMPDYDMSTTAYGLMLGYAMKDVVTVKAAYTSVDDKGVLTIQNTATGDQSKLYTEAWWNYGVVGQAGADSYMFNAEATFATVDFLAQYTHADVDHKGAGAAATMDEIAVTASKSFGPLDATIAYIYTKMDDGLGGNYITDNDGRNGKKTENRAQAYLTLNF